MHVGALEKPLQNVLTFILTIVRYLQYGMKIAYKLVEFSRNNFQMKTLVWLLSVSVFVILTVRKFAKSFPTFFFHRTFES